MRWLTLADIKDQLRIEQDDTSQDKLLTRYGATAENFTLGYLQRTEDELKAMNDQDPTMVPEDIVSGACCSWMLTISIAALSPSRTCTSLTTATTRW